MTRRSTTCSDLGLGLGCKGVVMLILGLGSGWCSLSESLGLFMGFGETLNSRVTGSAFSGSCAMFPKQYFLNC